MILGLSRKEYGENAEALLDKFYQQVLPSYKEGHAITLRDAIGDLPGLYPTEEVTMIDGRKTAHSLADSPIKIIFHVFRMQEISNYLLCLLKI